MFDNLHDWENCFFFLSKKLNVVLQISLIGGDFHKLLVCTLEQIFPHLIYYERVNY